MSRHEGSRCPKDRRQLICWTAACGVLLAVMLLCAPRLSADEHQLKMQEGVKLFSEGRFKEAAEIFEEALYADPSSEEARRNLANTQAALGHDAIKRNNWEEAKDYLEKAVETQPENAQFHLLLASILYRQGDYYYSRWAAKKSIELDPGNPFAHELMGDLLYQDGYLDLAIPEWETALEKSMNRAGIERKIDKAQKEIDFEQDSYRDTSRHFTLQIDSSASRDVFRTVLGDLEDIYDRLYQELGIYPPGDIMVILYTRKAFSKITQSPSWVGGAFDGKIRIPVGGLFSERMVSHVKPILAHELTHAFLRSVVPHGLPPWFEEGLAEYFEGTTVAAAQSWLEAHEEMTFSSLEDVSRTLKAGDGKVEGAYFASAIAVHTLVEEEGFWTIRNVLDEVGRGRSFEAVLEDEARLTIEEFEELWRRELP